MHISIYLSLGGWNRHTSSQLNRFKKQFLPAVSSTLENGPAILFKDGHASHINLEVIRPARAYGVIPSCLPSHTTHTHTLQLLDVGAYGSLKSKWGKILKEYKMETCCTGTCG